MGIKSSGFADRLTDLVEGSERSCGELSQKIGISRQTLSYYMNGHRRPDIDTAARMAQFFGVSMDELVGITINGNSDKTKYLPKAAAETLETLLEDERFNYWAVLLCDPNFLKLIEQLNSYLMAALTEDMEKIPELKPSELMPADIIRDWVNKKMYGGEPLSDVWKYRCTETFRALLSGVADFEKKCADCITETVKEVNASVLSGK